MRDWLFVDDHAQALTLVLERGRVGETYNIGGKCRAAQHRCRQRDLRCDGSTRTAVRTERRIASSSASCPTVPATISAMPSILASSTPSSAGRRSTPSKPGLNATVKWYLENRAWWEPLLSAHDADDRRGLPRRARDGCVSSSRRDRPGRRGVSRARASQGC